MIGEIFYYVAAKPNDNSQSKLRPILVVGSDEANGLKEKDIHYVIISASADCGKYDVKLDDEAINKGLRRPSVIKTTKIFTGSKTMLGNKVGKLPDSIMKDFAEKYKEYQCNIIERLTSESD